MLPRRADHLRQSFLTYLRYDWLGLAFFTVAREQEKNASETPLARVKKLVYQVCFISDVARQDIVDENLGKVFPLMKYIHHSGLFNSQKRAVHYRGSCHHAKSLACKASLTKKIASVKNADDRCLPLLGGDCELHPSFLDVEDEPSRLSLHKDTAFLSVFHEFSSPPKSSEEALRIKMRAREFLWHGPLQSSAS